MTAGKSTPFIALCLILLFGGCETTAQRDYQRAMTGGHQGVNDYMACFQGVLDKPIYRELSEKFSMYRSPPSLAQMTDQRRANEQDVRLILQFDSDMQPCFESLFRGAASISPNAVDVLRQQHIDRTNLVISLVQRRTTFGDYHQRLRDLSEEYSRRFSEVGRMQRQHLEARHAAELRQRQDSVNQVAANLAVITAIQQQEQMNRAMLQAASRPQTLVCSPSGQNLICQ